MAINDDLTYAVHDMAPPIYPGTRDEVIARYQEEYPGQRTLKNGQVRYEWKEKIISDELALNPNAKRASIARRYQNDTKTGKPRYLSTKPSKAQQAQYKELGETLEPMDYDVPEEGIDITYVGEAMISDNEWEGSFSIHVGKDASTFTDAKGRTYSMPTGDFFAKPDMRAVFKTYFKGQDIAHSYQGDIYVN